MKEKSFQVSVVDVPLSVTGIIVPEKVIPVSKAVNDYNNYYHNRIVHDSTDSTRTVWFDFRTLKDHLAHIQAVALESEIEITRLAFMLGADGNDKKTVFLAPMTLDKKFDIHRAFSIDNDKITFINRFPIEEHSSVTEFDGLQSTENSMLLGPNGPISSAEAINLYNNYFDTKVRPFSDMVQADTRYIYYEKGVFEEYLSYLEEGANAVGIQISGINAVFSVYDDHVSEGAYANHLNLFFVPTQEASGNSVAFICFDKGQNNTFDLRSLTLDVIEKERLSTMFNRGNGAPPPYTWD